MSKTISTFLVGALFASSMLVAATTFEDVSSTVPIGTAPTNTRAYFNIAGNNNEPEIPSVYHTISLEVASGIDLLYMSAGDYTVEEGGHLHLQFLPENRAYSAADVLFLIDGVEVEFRDFGAGHYFSYILNPIEGDHTILIAMKEYEVILPNVKGCAVYPLVGTHKVAYGKPFRFGILLPPYKDPDDITIFANGEKLLPEYAESFHDINTRLRSDELPETEPIVLIYTLDKVTRSLDITFEDINPTGNAEIVVGDVRVSTRDGKLIIENETGAMIDVTIYTLQGQMVASRKVLDSLTIDLSAGPYIVRAGTLTAKIILD